MAFLIPVLGLPILAITIPFVVEQHISNDNDRINDEVAAKFWQRDLHQTYAIPSSQHASDAGAPRHPHADPRKRQSEDWMGIGPVMAPLPTDLWNLTTSKSNWTNANSAQRSESSSQGLARVDAPTLLRFNTTELSDEQMGKFFDSADKSIQLEVHLTKPASHSKREDEDGSQVHEARVKLGDEVMAAEWRVHPSKGDGLVHGHLTFQPSDLTFPIEAAFALVNHTSADVKMKDNFANTLSTVQDLAGRPDVLDIAEAEAVNVFDAASKSLDGVDGRPGFRRRQVGPIASGSISGVLKEIGAELEEEG